MLTIGVSLMMFYSVATVCVQTVLDEQRVTRHAKTEGEIDQSREGETGEQRRRRRPDGITEGSPERSEQIEQRHNRDQRGILEQSDEAVDDAGDDDTQRIGHH